MATMPETQTYLNRVKAPTVTSAQALAAIRSFLAGAGKYQAEIALQIQELNDALMVETDPTLLPKLQLEMQTLQALNRELARVTTQAAGLCVPLNQFTSLDTNPDPTKGLRAAAALLGYTV